MQQFLQTLIFGLSSAGVIAVGAVGLTLSYGVTGFINFSYGELLTVGAFTTIAAVAAGVPLVPAAALAAAAAGTVAVVTSRAFFEPIRSRGPLPLLITSIGVAFILQNVIQIVFSADPQLFPVPLVRPWRVGAVFVPKPQVLVFVIGAATMAAIHLLLRHTLFGRKMRATADNDALARLSGVSTARTIQNTWLVSGGVAGLSGALLGVEQATMRPSSGFQFLLVLFAAVLVGGIGNPYGAALGAVIVGLGIEFGATYVSADYSMAVAFVALVVTLLTRPSGLLPGSRQEARS